MVYAWLNLGSIILGLLAWILPLFAIVRFRKNKDIYCIYMIYISLVSAILSLLFVITYRNHLINIQDLPSLMDTNDTFQLASVVMSVVTIVINSLALGFKFTNLRKK